MVRGKARESALKSVALGKRRQPAAGVLKKAGGEVSACSTEGCYKDGSDVGRYSEALRAGRWREGEWTLSSSPGPSSDISGPGCSRI